MVPARWKPIHIDWLDPGDEILDKEVLSAQSCAVVIQRLPKCRHTQNIHPVIADDTPAHCEWSRQWNGLMKAGNKLIVHCTRFKTWINHIPWQVNIAGSD